MSLDDDVFEAVDKIEIKKEKPLYEKTINDFQVLTITQEPELRKMFSGEWVFKEDLKNWAIAIVKERKCQIFKEGTCKSHMPKYQGKWCPNCIISGFLINKFELVWND